MKVNSTYLNFSIMSKFHSILQALALLLLPSLAAAQCDSTFDCSDKEEGRSPTSRAAGQAPCSNSQEVLALLRWTERALDLPRWSPVKYNAAWVTSVTAWTVVRGCDECDCEGVCADRPICIGCDCSCGVPPYDDCANCGPEDHRPQDICQGREDGW